MARPKLNISSPFALNLTLLLCLYLLAPSSAFSVHSTPMMMSKNSNEACNSKAHQCFQGSSVFITGASGGLGRSIAHQIAHCNAKSIVLSARDGSKLQKVAEECRGINPDIETHLITCDLASADDVQELAKQSLEATSGRIDILINNGGVSSRSRFLDSGLEVDQRVMQINFFAGAALAKAVTPGMVERGFGKVIWISSVQGLLGIPNRSSYAASKFAVQGYCESLRAELKTSGVDVHVPSPGYIRTNLSKSALKGDGTKYSKMDKTTEKGADPNDVAIDILENVAEGTADFLTAATFSAKAAIWLRFLLPSVLNNILVKRYEKSAKQNE